MNNKNLKIIKNISDKIYTIRGKQVMLDRDLAELYGVETKYLNRVVKRNIGRFPDSFRFKLLDYELKNLNELNNSLRCQNGTLKNLRGRHNKYSSYVFTEQGVAMLSSVIRSNVAVQVSIKIMNAFVNMRKFLLSNAVVFEKLDYFEQKISQYDKNFEKVFNAIEAKDIKPKQGIFYDGQIFDAYVFVSDLIKSATKEIILIDNYIDETVLKLFSKTKDNIKIIIYTKNITDLLKLDLIKYNKQYSKIEIKKWFGFSKFDVSVVNILDRLKK